MFGRSALTAICAAGVVFPCTSEARDLQLTPSSKWLMSYDRDSCTLARAFGEGDDKVIAQFIRYEPSVRFDFNLIGKPLRAWTNEPHARIRFGTTGEFVDTEAMIGSTSVGSEKMTVVFASGRLDNRDINKLGVFKMSAEEEMALSRIDPAVETAVASASIHIGGQTISLELGAMGAAMRAMRKCTTDLVKQWGFEPEQQAQRHSIPKPKSDPRNWLVSSDYPADSLFSGQQAIIRYRLSVNAEGTTTGCTVQSAIAEGRFAEVTCALLQRRARFDPARMSDGTAVASYYVSGVRWVIR